MKTFYLTLIGLSYVLVASAPFSFAQGLSLPELTQLNLELNSLSENQEMKCEGVRTPGSDQVFLFDGDLGFCPRYYFMNVARDGGDFGAVTLAQQLSQTELTPANESLLKKISHSLKNEDLIKNCLLIKTVVENALPETMHKKAQLHYYSKRGEAEAVNCARSFQKRSALGPIHLSVIAYSMGSEAAMKFARLLIPFSQTIDQVLSVDPVGRNVNWVTGVITTEDNSLFEVPSNVTFWKNYFQKQDHYSLLNTSWAHLGIRGSRVIGASLNQEIKASDFETEADRRKGHVRILKQPEVLQAMREII